MKNVMIICCLFSISIKAGSAKEQKMRLASEITLYSSLISPERATSSSLNLLPDEVDEGVLLKIPSSPRRVKTSILSRVVSAKSLQEALKAAEEQGLFTHDVQLKEEYERCLKLIPSPNNSSPSHDRE